MWESPSPDANTHWNPAKMAFAPNEVEMSLNMPLGRALRTTEPGLREFSPSVEQAAGLWCGPVLFQFGKHPFTDEVGTTVATPCLRSRVWTADSPKFSERFRRISARFIHSNLTGGTAVQVQSRPHLRGC